MQLRTRVYVSGPYSSDPEVGTALAVAAGQTLLDAGYAPIVPHLTHYWHTQHQENDYEAWMAMDFAHVAAAHAVLRLPCESSGADREVELAYDLSIPVYYETAALLRNVPTTMPHPRLPLGIERALDLITDIFGKKSADYAGDRDWRANFLDVAEQMGWDSPQEACEALIAVKQSRLKSLRVSGREPANEAVDDTVLDRAVYSIIRLGMDLEDNR